MTKQNKPWQDIADAAGILRAHKQMELADRLQKYAEALAQPEQEPVAWMYVNRSTHETLFQQHMRSFVDHSQWKEAPLYCEPLANQEKTSGSPLPKPRHWAVFCPVCGNAWSVPYTHPGRMVCIECEHKRRSDGRISVEVNVDNDPIKHKIEQGQRLYEAVSKLAALAGENADDTVDWLCGNYGGMAKLFEAYFAPKGGNQTTEFCPMCEGKPAARKPLTENRITEIFNSDNSNLGDGVVGFVRAIEAAHGIKE